MLTHGPARRVTICVGEDVHHRGEALDVVETAEELEALLPKLYEPVGPGIVGVQDTTVIDDREQRCP